MDPEFPPSPELTRHDLRQLALRELLRAGPFEPVTRNEWHELLVPQPDITQL